jgi:hypothetical protein
MPQSMTSVIVVYERPGDGWFGGCAGTTGTGGCIVAMREAGPKCVLFAQEIDCRLILYKEDIFLYLSEIGFIDYSKMKCRFPLPVAGYP